MLTLTRRSAVKARTQAANQLHSLVVGAPERIKDQLKSMKLKGLVKACARSSTQRTGLCQLREAGPPPLPGSRHRDRRAQW